MDGKIPRHRGAGKGIDQKITAISLQNAAETIRIAGSDF